MNAKKKSIRRAALLLAFALASLSLNGCLLTQLLGGAGGAGGLLGGGQAAAAGAKPPTATTPLPGPVAGALPGSGAPAPAPGGTTTPPAPTAPNLSEATLARIRDIDAQIATKNNTIARANELITAYTNNANGLDQSAANRGTPLTPGELQQKNDYIRMANEQQQIVTQTTTDVTNLRAQRDRLAAGQPA